MKTLKRWGLIRSTMLLVLFLASPAESNGPYIDPGDGTLTNEPTGLIMSDGETATIDRMVSTVDNASPKVVASGTGTYQVGDPVTLSGQASDYDGDRLGYEWLIDGEPYFGGQVETVSGGKFADIPAYQLWGLPTGGHTISLVVDDGINDPVSKAVSVDVIDTIAPTLAPTADKHILWPPNQKMVDVTIWANSNDNSGAGVNLSAAISSSESEDGLGNGATESDWKISEIDETEGTIYLKLRAEKSGRGQGRTYTVTLTAMDEAGNSSSSDLVFIVPHDNMKKKILDSSVRNDAAFCPNRGWN